MIAQNCFALLVIFVVLNCIDVVSTAYIIHNGFGREANPVMAFLIKHLELPLGLIVPKIFMIALVARYLGESVILLTICCLVYCFVAGNNLWLIYKRKRNPT